jgi:phage terminase large subunit
VINNKKVGDDVFKKILYIEHAKYGYHTELDHLPILLKTVPDSHKYEIRADNSRPETVKHLQTHGFPRVVSCDKGKGSVEEGIHYLLNYDAIVIHPNQKEMIEEAKFYSYKVDRDSGIILPDIIDAFNHGWDAIRYAHEPRMRHRGAMKISDDFLARI